MSYQKIIKDSLGEYKKIHFNGIENGSWRNSENIYPHILPKDKKELNLLPKYRDCLSNYMKTNDKLKPHIYFHHLNSSQAMCLNFFYPFLKEKKLEIILKAIGLENEKVLYEQCCFEKQSEIEKKYNKYRTTYFDFFVETESGKKIYFEIKYTEQKFGKAKFDKIHFEKYDTIYKNHLNSIKKKYHSRDIFLENYQIFRNIICVSENSYVVFLYPDGNKKIKEQAEFAKMNYLVKKMENRLININWEYLVSFTINNIKNEKIKTQINDFKEKYSV